MNKPDKHAFVRSVNLNSVENNEYSVRCAGTGSKFYEEACNNSYVFQIIMIGKKSSNNKNNAKYVFYENKTDPCQHYSSQKLGQANIGKLKYDASNNSIGIIIKKLEAEKERYSIEHVFKDDIRDSEIVSTTLFNIKTDLSMEQKGKMHTIVHKKNIIFEEG